MTIALIAAMDSNRLIGRKNTLPWHLPADLKRFKALTMGHPVVMGRKTHESIGKPLSGRKNIILTHHVDYAVEGCWTAHTVEEALRIAGESNEIFIIGGVRLYEQMLPRAERLYLTLIEEKFVGNVYFPACDPEDWVETSREPHEPDEKNPYRYSFVVMEKNR